VDVGDLEDRYDPVRMDALDIYPHGWTEDNESPGWLLEHYDRLAAYVQQAAGRRDALVISGPR
jgi:hypothetical protein